MSGNWAGYFAQVIPFWPPKGSCTCTLFLHKRKQKFIKVEENSPSHTSKCWGLDCGQPCLTEGVLGLIATEHVFQGPNPASQWRMGVAIVPAHVVGDQDKKSVSAGKMCAQPSGEQSEVRRALGLNLGWGLQDKYTFVYGHPQKYKDREVRNPVVIFQNNGLLMPQSPG